jgi:hypothetical protein
LPCYRQHDEENLKPTPRRSLVVKPKQQQTKETRRRKMTIVLTLLVAVIGLLMYALCSNSKLVEVGRIMFWTGLLAFLLGGGFGHAIQAIPMH